MMIKVTGKIARAAAARAARRGGQAARPRPVLKLIERIRARRRAGTAESALIKAENYPEIIANYPDVNLGNYPEFL